MQLKRKLVELGLAAMVLTAIIAVPIKPARGAPAKAKKAKKGKKPKGASGSLSEAAGQRLLEKSDGVQNCASTHALDHGANRVEIETKVTINSTGQVVNIVTVVSTDKIERAISVKECVDALLKGIKFPAIPAPLTTIERTWTIATS